MTCVPAPACRAARKEATERWPGRSQAADGICPSAEHTAQNPDSDHERGDAVDITHDPSAGCNGPTLVARIVGRRDPRATYLIHAGRIWRSYDKTHTDREMAKHHFPSRHVPAWTPEPYYGSNDHRHHVHISIKPEARNDVAPWFAPLDAPEDDMFTPKNGDDLAEALRLLRGMFPTLVDDEKTGHTSNLTKTLLAARAAATRAGAQVDVAALAAALRDDLGDAVADQLAERLKA